MGQKELTREIKERLNQVRETFDLSSADLSRTLGCGRTTSFRYERGLAVPSVPSCRTLAQQLDISLDWLLMGRGEMTYNPPKPKLELPAGREKTKNNQQPDLHKEGIVEEIRDLLEHMENDSAFRFEVLSMLHRRKQRGNEK